MSTTRQAETHCGDVVEVSGRRVGDHHGRMGEILELLRTRTEMKGPTG